MQQRQRLLVRLFALLSFTVVFWSSLAAVAYVALQSLSLEPEGRRTQTYHDHDHDGHGYDAYSYYEDYAWTRYISLYVWAGIFVLHVVAAFYTCLHWGCWIKPTANLYLPKRAAIPDDLKGSWKYGLFDCFGSCGTCLSFFFCAPCMTAELWYRNGWIHAMTADEYVDPEGPDPQMSGLNSCCPGWEFFAGCLAYVCFQEIAECLFPCILGLLSSGAFPIGNGIESTRERFGLPRAGFSTLVEDCCCWCWCGACFGTREYRQVMEVLKRGPVSVRPPPTPVTGMVVGQPIATGGVIVVGQVTQASKQ
mmetsp:Transcript_11306/g.20062  ORF Transcript_11306/g.20062 Transcript_11306/m.20062 type:complete len:307 (-) Transcript_11306:154-1074(-)